MYEYRYEGMRVWESHGNDWEDVCRAQVEEHAGHAIVRELTEGQENGTMHVQGLDATWDGTEWIITNGQYRHRASTPGRAMGIMLHNPTRQALGAEPMSESIYLEG